MPDWLGLAKLVLMLRQGLGRWSKHREKPLSEALVAQGLARMGVSTQFPAKTAHSGGLLGAITHMQPCWHSP